MKSISVVFALVATCAFGAATWIGCSSSDNPPANNNTDSGSTGGACPSKVDPLNPPISCSPEAAGATMCSKTTNVDSCPTGTCMERSDQTSKDVKNFRMGRIRLWAPDALLSLAPIAVDPNVAPSCFNGGTEDFTWLIQLDTKAKTVKTGGSRKSSDGGKTFSFLSESVDSSALSSVCPGFVGSATPTSLAPVTAPIKGDAAGTWSTDPIAKINVPIFDESTGIPIILPLTNAYLKDVTINGSCIGKWEKGYWCDGDSGGWTGGGAIIGMITAEDADKVPVKSAGCQSLCAILVSDATKTDGKTCKKGPDGKVPAIGNACVSTNGDTTCNNAFLLSATFGAYGVEISGSSPPPPDGGTDTGSDTGSDGGSDTGAMDAASGG